MINPTEYIPKSYHTRVSTYWWLSRWPYLRFILREASSIFVAWFVIVTLLEIRAVSAGPVDYSEFQQWLRNPIVLFVNLVTFLFVVFHAVTWFNLAPKAMAVRVAGKRLPAIAISGPQFVAWAAASAVVCWIVLR